MSSHRDDHASANFPAIAERLMAHARLCEQIARECRNEDTAEKLRCMARDRTQAAADIAPAQGCKSATRH
jgi:hypothetical protein